MYALHSCVFVLPAGLDPPALGVSQRTPGCGLLAHALGGCGSPREVRRGKGRMRRRCLSRWASVKFLHCAVLFFVPSKGFTPLYYAESEGIKHHVEVRGASAAASCSLNAMLPLDH